MSLLHAIRNNGLSLLVFALAAAGILAGTYEGTKARIAEAERRAAEKALFDIVPATRIDNDLLLDTWPIPESAWPALGLSEAMDIHLARAQGEVVAVIVPAIAPDGYSGDIRLLAGINRDGSVAGVRVLTHKETPGLGDKVDLKKSDWILGFNGKSLSNPRKQDWQVKKDGGEFDQFTGATITPRAVVQQVAKILDYVAANRDVLFVSADSPQESL